MYLEIYLDIIWIVNFIFNCILLNIIAYITKSKTSVVRILLASFSTAVAGTILYTMCNILHIIIIILLINLISLLNILLCFKFISLKDLVIKISLLYMISFTISGFVNYIYMQLFSKKLSLFLLLLLGSMMVFILKKIIKVTNSLKNKEDILYDIELVYDNKTVKTKALLDTGNGLYDIYNKNPVIIIESKILDEVIGKELKEEIRSISTMDISQSISCDNIRKYRIIPYKSIGNDNGFLVGLVFDELNIFIGKRVSSYKKITGAIYNSDLSISNNYRVILHRDLF